MTLDAKKILKIAALSVFLIFIFTFAFFRSKDLVFGVKIKEVNIMGEAKVADNILKVTGNAKNAVELTLNGRVISVDQRGNFNETIALLPGYNVIGLKAKDEFGNSDEKNYKLILEK